jgi:FtsH-binding integral membrane protein
MAANIDNFLNSFNTKFEAPVRGHLKNVYASLTMSVLSAAAGAYVHLFTNLLQGGGLLFSLLGAGLAFGLYLTPDNGKNRSSRLAMLLGFAFLTGLGLGPLLQLAVMMNPTIVPTALMVTSAVFACFSGAALFAPDGKYLYLGGTLLSGLSTLMMLGLMNIFFRSQLLFQAHIYIGLAIFCGFIMFDTQVIIRKARNGDRDFIAHSLDLFIDFVQIFRKVLILLMQKDERDNKKKQR